MEQIKCCFNLNIFHPYFFRIHFYNIYKSGTAVTAIKPCIWKILRKFHSLSPDGFPNLPEKDARYREKIPFTKPQLLAEIDKMEHLLGEQSIKSTKVVFAHNDLLLGNILTCQTSR